MNIVTLVLFVLIGTGITNIVVNAAILDFVRGFIVSNAYKINKSFGKIIEYLLGCMMCSGFWIGVLFSIFFPINIISAGAIISLSSHFYNTLIIGLEGLSNLSKIVVVEDVEED